ncbi:ABC transporter ATP-binding protein [Planococcus salinarum]|uniref:ABC transporter ATP-binding protein n=1 Tax=Planococcus salinarum TaxID=622695 RepID=UPI000E3E5CED|nr:ABC transporter ATP-binding protein [Planococcus salinarum]TAA72753.1 ABC transporter ATP-binding protein [Planococcus salinarum]
MPDSIFSMKDVSFRFPDDVRNTLSSLSFSIVTGERVAISGPSGSGKSTLLYLLNRLYPMNCDGIVEGDIHLFGKRAESYAPGEINHRVATVFQDPDSQFCMPTVEEELAFTLENLNTPAAEMTEQIRRVLESTGLAHLRNAKIQTLSGGMKQRVATACALVMDPEVLLLDEPISHLDPKTAKEFIGWLDRLQKTFGITVIAVEHRLDSWGSFFDREILIDADGAIEADRKFIPHQPFHYPLRLNEVLDEPAISATGLSVKMGGKTLLHPLSLQARRGECIVIAGPNGSGKSTLVKALCGIHKKSSGTVTSNPCGYVPQSPEFLFLTPTVRNELAFSGTSSLLQLQELMDSLRLTHIAAHNPFAVSHGQKRRVAIGAMLADKRHVLFLDEPTSGQDRGALLELFDLIDSRLEKGDTVFIVTHDMEFAAAIADGVLLLKDGRMTGMFPAKRVWEDPALLAVHHLLPPKGAMQHAESPA